MTGYLLAFFGGILIAVAHAALPPWWVFTPIIIAGWILIYSGVYIGAPP